MAKDKDEVKLTLRLPADLHQRIKQLATDQQRSLNKQIEYLLREAANRARVRREK